MKKGAVCYPITGIIKHAQVARILAKNNVSPRQFYLVCRACQEHLPLPTLRAFRAELGARGATATRVAMCVNGLRKRGLLRRTGKGRAAVFDATDKGYIFYLMLIAEMERPIRENTVYDHPKKTAFKRPHGLGPKGGRAMRKVRFSALAKKRGISIWDRCEWSALPQWQSLAHGEFKSLARREQLKRFAPTTLPPVPPATPP